MKKSTKLILFALSILLLLILILIVWFRVNLKEFVINPSGKKINKSITLNEFETVTISGNFETTLIIDSTYTANFQIDENFVQFLEIKQDNKNLTINTKKGLGLNNRVKLDLGAGELSKIYINSGSNLKSKDTLHTDNLTINISAGSHSDLILNINNLKAQISSGSTFDIAGKTIKSEFEVSSGSTLQAFELKTDTTIVNVSSGSGAKINASKAIFSTASSGSSIIYKGEAQILQSDISSGAKISKY